MSDIKDTEERKKEMLDIASSILKNTYTIEEIIRKCLRDSEDKKIPISLIIKGMVEKAEFLAGEDATPEDLGITDEIIIKGINKIIADKLSFASDCEVVDGVFQFIEHKPLKFTLEVPSGTIVADDWLRDIGEHEDIKSIEAKANYINTVNGTIDQTNDYAAIGIAHGFVGNSCPTIYQDEENGFYSIGCAMKKVFADYPEAEEEEDYDFQPENPNLKDVGNVCTDLWWYSIMDKDKYLKMGGKLENADNVIDIPAGTYEFEHYYGISSKGYHPNEPYAIFRKID